LQEVGRKQQHSDDLILDAAGELLLENGARAATIEAIAQASGAPTGSIYYRFKSRDELFATLWLRAAGRFQATLLAQLDHPDPLEATVNCALSVYDFCDRMRPEARLLMSAPQEKLWDDNLRPQLRKRLKELNRPIDDAQRMMAKRLYGDDVKEALRRLRRVVFELPYGIARDHVITNRPLPRSARADLEYAVRAVLAAPLQEG
jgi:AcrR family transcriptional regulator